MKNKELDYNSAERLWKMFFPHFGRTHGISLVQALWRMTILVALAAIAIGSTGCATSKTTTTKDGTTITSTRTDPLLTKTVEESSRIYGLDFNFLGGSSFSPFHIKVGIANTKYSSLPTGTSQIYTAPYNTTDHHNYSLIQQADDGNVTTIAPGLPSAAYIGPNIATLNPISAVNPAVATNAIANGVYVSTNGVVTKIQ